jgi:hypothetical protein
MKSSIFPCLNIILLLSVSNIRYFLASKRKNVPFPSNYSRNYFYFLYYPFLQAYTLQPKLPFSLKFPNELCICVSLNGSELSFFRSIAKISSKSTTKSGK